MSLRRALWAALLALPLAAHASATSATARGTAISRTPTSAPGAGSPTSCAGTATGPAAARDRVAAFARQHRKPLMVAEASPKARYEADVPDAWSGWHARVFAWIAKNDVKAYCCINQDWNALPQWTAACGQGDWGDTRVQKPGSLILDAWRREVSGPRWLKQGPRRFPAIGFVR
jgi:hypothetical protein